MESETASLPETAGSGATGSGGAAPSAAGRPRRTWWPIAVLAAVASLVVGGSVQHAFDQRNAARDLYRRQMDTTFWRINYEEGRQLALPVAQRSASAFGDLVNSINSDTGVNGYGTLEVSLGAGSVAPRTQIAFSATVASPYASTTFAVWFVSMGGGGSVIQDVGSCVLWSSLLGPGRATGPLQLGGGEFVQPCLARWWSANPADPAQPRLDLAGIPRSPGHGG